MADDPESSKALIKLIVVHAFLVVVVAIMGGGYVAWTLW